MVKNVLKFYLLFLPLLSFGQSPQEIESAEFIVEKDKDLKLPKRQRLFEHVKSSPTSAGFDSLTFVLKEIHQLVNFVPTHFCLMYIHVGVRKIIICDLVMFQLNHLYV